MESEIIGKPAFAYVNVVLAPGESLVAQPDAMSSMDADLDLQAKLNGGIIGGLLRKYLGGESLFINHFTNNTGAARRLTLVQKTPGDIDCVDLNGAGAEETAAAIRTAGGEARSAAADVADPARCRALVAEAVAAGQLRIVLAHAEHSPLPVHLLTPPGRVSMPKVRAWSVQPLATSTRRCRRT